MNGLRRPHFDRERSAITPIRGWIIKPDKGPAIQTNEVFDFVNPSCRRYGVQSNQDEQALASNSIQHKRRFNRIPTGHLRAPCKPVLQRNCQPLNIHRRRSACVPSRNVSRCTHCNPTRLNVNNAILIASDRPLIEGVPAHRAACGILAIRLLAYAQPPPLPRPIGNAQTVQVEVVCPKAPVQAQPIQLARDSRLEWSTVSLTRSGRVK